MRLGQHMSDEQRTGVSAAVKAAMLDPEVRAKLSAARMGNTNLLGYHHSAETRTKMSKARMGKSPWNKGILMSEEVCLLNRLGHLGIHPSEETKAKMSAANINPSAERRAKMSVAGMGRSPSPETRAKLSMRNWKGGRKVTAAKHNGKRRTFGFNPLNSWFVGCEAHHINPQDVIYMPKKMHRSIYHNQFTGRGMAEMNALAGQYLTEDWT